MDVPGLAGDQSEGLLVEVPAGYDEAVVRARLAFRAEGFSVLSEMHVGDALGPEAGAGRKYLIMGLWNGLLEEAHIGPELRVAAHLPCNLVIQEQGAGAIVAVLDPDDVVDRTNEVAVATAAAAGKALQRVLEKVAAPA